MHMHLYLYLHTTAARVEDPAPGRDEPPREMYENSLFACVIWSVANRSQLAGYGLAPRGDLAISVSSYWSKQGRESSCPARVSLVRGPRSC